MTKPRKRVTSYPIPVNLIEEIQDRFWTKIKKGADDECWECQRPNLLPNGGVGYGTIKRKGKQYPLHRVSWVIHFGEIPDGLLVCHTCDNPPCCNPAHLFLGTHKDNADDKVSKGRQAKGITNGAYTKPWTRARGDRNGSRTKPERRPRGDQHWTRVHPEKLPRGADHIASRRTDYFIRGTKHHDARLTEDNVREVRKRHALGETKAGLAREFGINETSISKVVSRKSWKHVI